MIDLRIFITMVGALAAGCVGPEAELPSREEAQTTLHETEIFAGPYIGFAAAVPPQVYAFNTLLRERDAAELFAELQLHGQLAGQLYALSGLYLTDEDRFDEIVEAYLDTQRNVETFFGCIVSSSSVASVTANIITGELPEGFRDAVDDEWNP